MLESIEPASASPCRLHFVENERNAMGHGNRSDLAHPFIGCRNNTTFALNDFSKESGGQYATFSIVEKRAGLGGG